MQIAVTGAAGRVGKYVVADMLAHGHEVVAVDIADTPPTDARFLRANVEDTDSLAEAFAGCDAIVHLAAIPEAGIAPADTTFRVNAQGTVNCLEAAERAGVGRFVLASSEATRPCSRHCAERHAAVPFVPACSAVGARPRGPAGARGSARVGQELGRASMARAGHPPSHRCLKSQRRGRGHGERGGHAGVINESGDQRAEDDKAGHAAQHASQQLRARRSAMPGMREGR